MVLHNEIGCSTDPIPMLSPGDVFTHRTASRLLHRDAVKCGPPAKDILLIGHQVEGEGHLTDGNRAISTLLQNCVNPPRSDATCL